MAAPFFYGDSYGGVGAQVQQAAQFQSGLVQHAIDAARQQDEQNAARDMQKYLAAVAMRNQMAQEQQQARGFDLQALLAAQNQVFAKNQDTREQEGLGLRKLQETRLGEQLTWDKTRQENQIKAADDAAKLKQILETVRSGVMLADSDLAALPAEWQRIVRGEISETKRLKDEAEQRIQQEIAVPNRLAQAEGAIAASKLENDRSSFWRTKGAYDSILKDDEKTALAKLGLTPEIFQSLKTSAPATIKDKDFGGVLNPDTGFFDSRISGTNAVRQFIPGSIPRTAPAIQAPILPQSTRPGERTVRVVGPNGVAGSIPYSQLADALRRGARIEQLQ